MGCGLGDLVVGINEMISRDTIRVFNQQEKMTSVCCHSAEDEGSGPHGADCWSQVASGRDLARSGGQQEQLHCVQQR